MWATGGIAPTAITPTSLELIINLWAFRLKLLVCILIPVLSAMKKLWKLSPPNLSNVSKLTSKELEASNKAEPDICPFDFILKKGSSCADFISVSSTKNPPMEAETNLA